MKREAITDRVSFNINERRIISKKSGCKCAHCGKNLNLKSAECTVEHIIPLSKGGTNDYDNLTLLCYDCNQSKSNLIIDPKEYYKFVNDNELREILLKYRYYLEDVNWLSTKNYFPEDAFNLYMKIGRHSKNAYPFAFVKKAHKSELDEITEFVKAYHNKVGIDDSDVREIVEGHIRLGAIYNVRNRNEILASIPVVTSKRSVKGKVYYMICISGIPCLYRKQQHSYAIVYALQRLMACICEMTPHNEIVFSLDVPMNDPFMDTVALSFYPDFESYDDEGEFKSYVYVKKLSISRDALEFIPDLHEKNNTEKVLSSFSKFLQRRMGLRPLDPK